MSVDYPTKDAIERAEASFSSPDHRCSALCRELRSVDSQLEDALLHDARPERIDDLNARFLAITNELKRLNCPTCNLP